MEELVHKSELRLPLEYPQLVPRVNGTRMGQAVKPSLHESRLRNSANQEHQSDGFLMEGNGESLLTMGSPMKELHVYSNPSDINWRGEATVFYSRRADGPFYRWLHMSNEPERWTFSRVHLSRDNVSELCIAKWTTVPVTLRARLCEHYLE